MITIAHDIGDLVRYEVPDVLNLNSYIRFKVTIDFTKPLNNEIKLKLGGDLLTLPIRYEQLLLYCYGCGKIEHGFQKCGTYDSERGAGISDLDSKVRRHVAC